MTESTTKRRIWIRNAIIIILLVLLVLTLFSNTILNHSLPEVAVQYPQYASIASRIRATGVVEANQSYTVSIEQSRMVESIAVRVGQSVAKGDILMKLETGDSRELDEARLALSNLELELIRKKQEDPALSADAAKDTYQALLSELTDAKATLALIQTELADIKAQQAKIPSYDEIQNAKIIMSQAQSMVDYYTAEIARLGGKQGTLGGNGYYTAEEIANLLAEAQSAYDAAQQVYGEAALAYAQADAEAKTWKTRLEDAQKAVEDAKAAVADYESKRPGSVTAETVQQKKAEYENLKAELEQKERYFTEDRYQEAKKAYDAARAEYDAKKNSASAEDLAALKAAVEAAAKALEPLESEYRALLQLRQSVYTAEQQYNMLVMQYMQSMQSDIMLSRLNGAVKQAEADVETIQVSLRDAEMVLEQCKAQYEQADATVKQAEADLKQIQNYQSYEELGEEIQELTQKKNDLEKQMRDAQALIDSGSDEGVRQIQTRVNEKNREITAQTKVINDLEKQVAAAKANADGTSDTAKLNQKQYEIEVKRIEDQIAKQEKEIARLEKVSVETDLTSPVSGVIESISALVGKTAEANAALMTITVSDMGYTVKCTVSSVQPYLLLRQMWRLL